MNLRDIFLAGAFAQGGGGAVSPEQITEAVNNYLDKNPVGIDLAMTGAAVGQIAKITAVDASGVPTAWKPVDMPGGGGGGDDVWELMATVDMVQGAAYAQVDLPAPVKKLLVFSGNGNALLTSDNIAVRLAVGTNGYNNQYFGSSPDAKNSETWMDLTIYVDFTIADKPFQLTSKGARTAASGAYMEHNDRYIGTMTPQSFYITTFNGAGIFNEKKFTVYGVRA